MRQTFLFPDARYFSSVFSDLSCTDRFGTKPDGHENAKQNENHENKDAELPAFGAALLRRVLFASSLIFKDKPTLALMVGLCGVSRQLSLFHPRRWWR
jgi:hypothetical protein